MRTRHRANSACIAIFPLISSVLVANAVGCASKATDANKRPFGSPYDPGAFEGDPDNPPLPPPREPDYVGGEDGGAFTIPQRARDAASPPDGDAVIPTSSPQSSASDGGSANDSGSAPNPTPTPSGPVACPSHVAPGDLRIVEMMIASTFAPTDRGEWIEIQSTRKCILNVRGVRIESPRGASSVDGVTIGEDLFIPPNGTFIVADSTDRAVNHAVPGLVVALDNAPSDVLRNSGDTVSLMRGSTVIDKITYPALRLAAARSITFPADCRWSDRSNWARWSESFHSWTRGFIGTPNADNNDVACY